MEASIAEVQQLILGKIGNITLTINLATLIITYLIMGILVMLSVYLKNRLTTTPGRLQGSLEWLLISFRQLCREAMGTYADYYFPLITTLFIFIWIMNIIGIIPGLTEPTRDLNTTLAAAFIAAVVAHSSGLKLKGLKKYLMELASPNIYIKGIALPNPAMFFLNIIGECGKFISHSFRLFGNILGGAIIVTVIGSLSRHLVLPIGLNIFFGFLTGTIQAFVFAMLAMTYITMAIDRNE